MVGGGGGWGGRAGGMKLWVAERAEVCGAGQLST